MVFQLSKPIDKSLFCDDKSVNTLYGLPKDIKFCRSCVISNQRPSSSIEFKNDGKPKANTHFDEYGICDACVKDEKIRLIGVKEKVS